MQSSRFSQGTLLLIATLLLAGCGQGILGPPTPEGNVPVTMTPTTQVTDIPTETPTAARTSTPRTPTITPIKLPSSIADVCLQRAIFGDPAASPYILPYPVGKSYLVSQSYCNRRVSHANQLAYDFNIPIGEDIIASRAGKVVRLWEETRDGGYGADNNYLFIRHTDGTVAMYAHLKQYGIDVEVGDYVEQGQRIAASGNSGTGGIPHLHFGVYASWPNVGGFDVPVNFSNAEGSLDTRGGLAAGQEYKALPYSPANPALAHHAWDPVPFQPGQGCSTVYATDGQQILGGNNEDSGEPLTNLWFVPATEDTFGLVLFGYNYRTQGGMNDQGLFFDLLTGNKSLPIPIEGKQLYTGTNYLIFDALARCATVACVVEMFETYYDAESWSFQAFYGDATGESVIVEPQAILRQRGGYQVATNFYQSPLDPEQQKRACPRFKTATEMLEGSPPLSVEYIRDVMAAVHQDERGSPTVYTNVYDLVNRLVYLYYFFDYEHVVVIDLEEELAKGAHAYNMPALFPPNPAAQKYSASALQGYQNIIQSRRVEVDPAFLGAYVGEYAPDGSEPRAPGEWVSVVAYGTSLMMIFPDSHRYELFPQSETSFFVVTWNKSSWRFQVQFEVEFGLDEATGQVLYMDWVFGPGDNYVRNDRLNLDSFVPYIPTPPPTSTPRPTVTPQPTATAEPTSAPPEPAPTLGFPWGWAIAPVAVSYTHLTLPTN